MSNIRQHLLAEVEAGKMDTTFTLKELAEKFGHDEFWLIDGKKYDANTVKTIFSNNSIGPGDRVGESVKRGSTALFIKGEERGTYTILIDDEKGSECFNLRPGRSNTVSSIARSNTLVSNKDTLITSPLISQFVREMALLIADKKRFEHSFDIKDKAWGRAKGTKWSCGSLLHAKKEYWWNGDYETNKAQLHALSQGLKESIDSEDEVKALYFSLRTLEWGEVYRGAVKFLLDSFDNKCIVEKLKTARRILDGNEYAIEQFENGHLRMDSGMTKVYSLICNASVIMDSRVAAAMTLIAERLFNREEKQELSTLQIFACGTSTTSDKKRRTINNKKVFSRVLKPANQAHHNIMANWLIQESVLQAELIEPSLYELWEEENRSELMRSVEAALFMIGSDISNG
ncbi:hypothetical protein [Alteromonas facilis]|uniref:hypothetical protein n=1 Tax=Alteromonas facilis TaxID=2048004 RepID=UPI000C28AE52|nr:hypothetical protein [Alteromonas facilis]